jgi:hypothetical protein
MRRLLDMSSQRCSSQRRLSRDEGCEPKKKEEVLRRRRKERRGWAGDFIYRQACAGRTLSEQ